MAEKIGFLGRLFGKAKPPAPVFNPPVATQPGGLVAPPPPRQPSPAAAPAAPAPPRPAVTVEIPADPQRGFRVAGVSHRQPAFEGVELGVNTLWLRPEPTNPHDRRAIAVHLAQGPQCGYLTAEMAKQYNKVITKLSAEGAVTAHGFIDTWDGGKGATVFLPDVELLTPWANAAPGARAGMPIRRVTTRLKKSKEYQDELGTLTDRRRIKTPVKGTATADVTPKGKYAGQTLLRFDVDGLEVGVINAQYRDEVPELFDQVETSGPAAVDLTVFYYRDSPLHAQVEYLQAAPPPSTAPAEPPSTGEAF